MFEIHIISEILFGSDILEHKFHVLPYLPKKFHKYFLVPNNYFQTKEAIIPLHFVKACREKIFIDSQ